MIPAGDAIEYRRLRAPQNHGGVLIDPPLATIATHLAANRALASDGLSEIALDQMERPHPASFPGTPGEGWSEGFPCVSNASHPNPFSGIPELGSVLGRPLSELAAVARRELLSQARQFTSNYRDIRADESLDANSPIVLTGHQPQLYHPGVWFKNFALSALARRHQAHAVNLLIDNDTLRTASLRVPAGNPDEPHIASVPFDTPADEIPFEERSILDRACFDSFGERAAATLAPFVQNPLVRDLWPHAIAAAQQSPNLGQAVSRARHLCEAEAGLHTFELPLSTVCQSESFRRFALHLLLDAPRLRNVYNSTLAEYRRVHHVRSRSHPVPDLAAVVENGDGDGDGSGDWHESPFWIWTTAAPRRRQLFVRRVHDELQLTDRGSIDFRLDIGGLFGESSGADRAIQQLAAAEVRGIKLRPRALVTTLYARLVLSDLFLHGIGGAKYDQLTDAIIRRFFGLVPPVFLTLTATAELPITLPFAADDGEVRLVDYELRELQFHPEIYCAAPPQDATARELIETKRRLLATVPPRGRSFHNERVERFLALRRVNDALQPFVAERRAALLARRPLVVRTTTQRAMLASREFSFCLFPKKYLFSLLLDTCNAEP